MGQRRQAVRERHARISRIAAAFAGGVFAFITAGCARAEPAAPLVLERTIPLADVAGRIDHLAIDPTGAHLVVAELGNDALDVIDLAAGKVIHRITGLSEPQGVAFDASGKIIVVAERGGGAARLFDAETFAATGQIPLGEDADNVRIDAASGHALVGYAGGALAVIDLAARKVLTKIDLPAHPESFQIEPGGARAFVNLPDARTIAAVDLARGAIAQQWKLSNLMWNFPLALVPDGALLASVFRLPARLVLFDRTTGAVAASQPTCGDSDDLFFDAAAHSFYVVCGAGGVDVFTLTGKALSPPARVPTRSGARTGLFSPGLGRLFVAAPARNGRGAEILVLKRRD
jgi:YVTN family beta-propeller protein